MALLDDTQGKESLELYFLRGQDTSLPPRLVFIANPLIGRRNSFPQSKPFFGTKLTIEGLTLNYSPAYFRSNLVLIHP